MRIITALILLPIEYNPDKKGRRGQVPIKKIQDTAVEILERFKVGCTIDPYPKHGIWTKLGVIYEDINVVLEINSLPIDKKEKLIKYCQEKLLKRFSQEAILIKFVPQIQAELVTVKK